MGSPIKSAADILADLAEIGEEPDTTDFAADLIDNMRAGIATAEGLPQPAPVKRGPGRPRKDGTAPAAVKAATPAVLAPKPRTRTIVTTANPNEGVVSVFDHLRDKVWSYAYAVRLEVGRLVGGTPTDKKVAEGWIRTKMGESNAQLISEEVERVMESRGVSAEAAVAEVSRNRNLSGFRRDFTTALARQVQARAVADGAWVLSTDNVSQEHRTFTVAEAAERFGELYIEGRQIKAMLKESVMIAVAAGRIEARGWGTTNKTVKPFLVEHLFVPEDRVYLAVTDPTHVNQSFVHTFRGAGIKLEEVLEGAVVEFTIECDIDFEKTSKDFWGHLLLTAEENGLGASRSQGFGRFKTTKFERIR